MGCGNEVSIRTRAERAVPRVYSNPKLIFLGLLMNEAVRPASPLVASCVRVGMHVGRERLWRCSGLAVARFGLSVETRWAAGGARQQALRFDSTRLRPAGHVHNSRRRPTRGPTWGEARPTAATNFLR